VVDRRLERLALVAVVLVAGLGVHRYWKRELSHLTGPARWIWVTDALEHLRPAAGLFVARLRLQAPPSSALLKVCGDREYVVYVNGTVAACGWSRPGFRLDLYDVAHLLRQGDNVIAVEIRSPTPVGGLLLALDVGNVGRNILVSGPAFVSRSRFSLGPPGKGDSPVPVIWGSPPRYPWAYPSPLPYPRSLDEVEVEDPVRIDRAAARAVPGGGLEFDLPRPVFGYLRVDFQGDGAAFVSTAEEPHSMDADGARNVSEPVVRLLGESQWLQPEPRMLSRVWLFGSAAPQAVEVWPVPEEFRLSAPGVVQGTHGPELRTRWTIRTHPE
jgi:hypothetical protein